MEFKRFAGHFQLLWSRITFSRLTLVYFIFSLLYFTIQLAFQIQAYTINAGAHHVIDKIIHDAGTVNASLPLLRGSRLHMCSWIPSNLNTDVATCPIIWDADQGDTTRNNSVGPIVTTASPSSTVLVLMPTPNVFAPSETSTSDEAFKSLRDLASLLGSLPHPTALPAGVSNAKATELSQQCLWALNWPNVGLRNTQREDSVFIAFQFWVLAVSIRAVWNESIPHILASLLSHLMATIWGVLQIMHTADFRAEFNRVITNGACKRIILNTSYWNARRWAEIYSLGLNGLALMISCALTWNLIKFFGWQTFKRIGASRTVNRAYKLFLSLSITIQLSFFFMAVTISLWIDQLMNSGIGDFASFLTLYKATSFVTLVLLIPWSMTGWFGVRCERQLPTLIFLILSILYLAGWGVMFFSTTFRWTFTTWFFFSVMASASVFLTFMGMALGIVCRFNFGTGLARCLNANQPLCEEDGVSTEAEKVPFPSSEEPFAFFGKHEDNSTFKFGFNSSFNSTVQFVTFPQSALQRQHCGDVEIHRSHSPKSSKSSNIESSHSRSGSSDSNNSQRWIIE